MLQILEALHVGIRGIAQCQRQRSVLSDNAAKVAETACHHIKYAALSIRRHLLYQTSYGQAWLFLQIPVIGLNFVGNQLHQGRFTGAIAAHQTEPFTRFNR